MIISTNASCLSTTDISEDLCKLIKTNGQTSVLLSVELTQYIIVSLHTTVHGSKQTIMYVLQHVKLAKEFESMVREDKRFEICAEVVMGLVCFRLKVTASNNIEL